MDFTRRSDFVCQTAWVRWVVALPLLCFFVIICEQIIPPVLALEKKARAETLVFVDLSSSLSPDQRQKIPSIVNSVVESEPEGTKVIIYVLSSDPGIAAPLKEVQIPNRSNMTNTQRINAELARSVREKDLQHQIQNLIDMQKRNKVSGSSCYLSSFAYVDEYFARNRDLSARHAIWVGDMIEACKQDPRYKKFNLEQYRPRADSQAGMALYVESLQMKVSSLPIVMLTAVSVPRSPTDIGQSVRSDVVKSYWQAVEAKIGLAPDKVSFRPPSDFQPHQ